jgi:hypothetical protein
VATSTGTNQVYIYPTNTTNTSPINIAANAGLYIWGAQLEEGSTASPYIKTTNLPSAAPRFDHDPTTNASLGLLVEESRTNVMLYSEDFTNTYWTTQNGLTDLNTNGVLNPKGDQAYLYTANSGSARKRLITANTTPGAVSFAFSIYIKSAGARYVQLLWAPTGFDYCNFDLVAGTPGTKGSGISDPKITDVGDGWYRLSMYVQNTTPTQVFSILAVDSASAAFAASATYTGEAFYLFGVQVEEGAFATSYIPTSGSTVTRAADNANITGSNFGRWYEQNEGTLLTAADYNGTNSSNYNIIAEGYSGTSARDFTCGIGASNPNFTTRYSFTSLDLLPVGGPIPTKTAFKLAGSYSADGSAAVFNGGAVQTTGSAASALTPADAIAIGRRVGGSLVLNGHIARLTYYPYRLPDATLQEITS